MSNILEIAMLQGFQVDYSEQSNKVDKVSQVLKTVVNNINFITYFMHIGACE